MQIKKLILSNTFLTKVAIYFRKLYLKRKFNITYGRNVFIGFSVICEGRNGFANHSSITSSEIGYGSYIAQNTKISKSKIGRYCSIGPNVSCIFGKHPAGVYVSTHPAFFSLNTPIDFTYVNEQSFEEHAKPKDENGKYSIIIGNDVWIGANVSIMDGVEIGDGAIIAANALVNKDVKPYTIVGGVPAKIIKKRFTDHEIDFLLKFGWWNRPKDWIEKNISYFDNIEDFQKEFINE